MGLYSSIVDLSKTLAGMGVNSSGVRQVVEAVGSEVAERITRTATVLRRVSIIRGLLGNELLVLLADQISLMTLGDDKHNGSVALLSLVVLI
jgi:PST family polysaccharide transporter